MSVALGPATSPLSEPCGPGPPPVRVGDVQAHVVPLEVVAGACVRIPPTGGPLAVGETGGDAVLVTRVRVSSEGGSSPGPDGSPAGRAGARGNDTPLVASELSPQPPDSGDVDVGVRVGRGEGLGHPPPLPSARYNSCWPRNQVKTWPHPDPGPLPNSRERWGRVVTDP